MKSILFAFFILTVLVASAQVPQSLNYQAVARDNNGDILSNQIVRFRFTLNQGSINGAVVFSETHLLSTNEYGLANLSIGTGTLVSGNFSTIDWSTGTYFLKVELDPVGGNNFSFLGSSQLLSVPYAQYASKAKPDGAAGGDLSGTFPNPVLAPNAVGTADIANGAVTAAKLNSNGALSGQVMKWNGSLWAAADDNSGGGSQWLTNGSNIYYNLGNVGVGDDTPASAFTVGAGDKFQVNGTTGALSFTDPTAGITFPANPSASSIGMIRMFASGTSNADRMILSHSPGFPSWGIEYKDTTDVIYFRSSSSRKFGFDLASGEMGVNVENPSFRMDIKGRIRLQGEGSASTSAGIWFRNQGDTFDRAFFGMCEPDSCIGIYSQNLGKNAIEFEIMREPRIGINIPAGSPPRAEVHLYHTNFGGSNDGVRIQNEGSNGEYWNLYTSNTTGDFEFFQSGIKRATIDETSGAYTAVSDSSLKTNIRPLESVLSNVMLMKPKKYLYKGHEDAKEYSGFIAQELERLFPQFVFFGGDDQKMYTVDYAGISVVAIKAIQEQQSIIQDQNNRIDELENALTKLNASVEKLLSEKEQ